MGVSFAQRDLDSGTGIVFSRERFAFLGFLHIGREVESQGFHFSW